MTWCACGGQRTTCSSGYLLSPCGSQGQIQVTGLGDKGLNVLPSCQPSLFFNIKSLDRCLTDLGKGGPLPRYPTILQLF